MALLGTWIDKTSQQTIGGAAGANFFQTTAFNLLLYGAATTPDIVLPVARSIQASTAAPAFYGFGANSSISTLGMAAGTIAAASAPLCTVDVYNILLWAPIK